MNDGFEQIIILRAEAMKQKLKPTHVRLGRDERAAIDLYWRSLNRGPNGECLGIPRPVRIFGLAIIEVDQESLVEVVSKGIL